MVAAHLATTHELITLIDIRLVSGETKRFQSGQPATYFYQGNPYEYIPLDSGLPASRSIGLGDSGQTIRIRNADAKHDTIRPIRDWLRNNDGWRKAKVVTRTLWTNDLSAQPFENRYQVLSSSVRGADAALVLKSSANATNITVPTLHLTRAVAPELPNNPPGRI